MFAKTLLAIVLIGTLMGLIGVWFPHVFSGKVGEKLVWSFVVLAIGVAIATGVLQYLPPPK